MINSLRAQNFRSYSDSSFEFDPSVNIVVGPNASGKTNLLEAVLVLTGSASWRGRDADLVKFKKDWSRLDGQLGGQTRSWKLQTQAGTADKEYLINQKVYRRLPAGQTVPVVYFEPNHLQLISRGPSERRDFIDDLLIQTTPELKPVINAYRRTLAQRNALLKQGRRSGANQIFAWNIRLSELGERIAGARADITAQANRRLADTYSQIAGRRSGLTLQYKSQFPAGRYGSRLLAKLESNIDTDYERGFTGHGPHRDDFIFYLNGQPAPAAASRGEVRSIMLAFKVFELVLVGQSRSIKPIFLLDDVFSELDGARRHALVDFISPYQTIITTTEADSVVGYFSPGQKLIALTRARR